MSHELFHDVTDRRPRASRAAGGTLALSIVAHALVLAAVIVVPLFATDALPLPASSAFPDWVRVELPPPPPAPAVVKRTHDAPASTVQNVAPTEAPSQIVDEAPPDLSIVCDTCVVESTNVTGLGVVGSTGPSLPAPPTPPAPEPPAKPLRLSSVQMPKKVRDVAPIYPQIAQRAGVEGVVIIEAVIAADGHVRDARVLRSQHALLDRAALDAVREWRYEPTRVGGVAVPVIVTVTVQFRLQR